MMVLHCFEILLFLSAVLPQHESLFSRSHSSEHFHLEEAQPILPKHTSSIKIIHPISGKFYASSPFLKPLKKQPKFVKPSFVGKITLPDSLKLTDEKDLFQPVSLGAVAADDFNSLYSPKQTEFEDVKPVTEIIEGDLKYDFRTKTHSI